MILALFLAFLAPATAPAAGLLCETAGGTKPAQLVVKAGGGHKLFVCAVKSKRHDGKLELSGFRVFMIGKSGRKMKKPLFESDLDSKVFRAERKDDTLSVTELLWDGRVNAPAFETVLSCDKAGCHVTKPPKCVFEKPQAGSRRALEKLGEYQRGKEQGKVPPKKLIDSAAALAYSGDSEAQAFFHDRGSLALDGDASDAYFDHQGNLERLKKAGCL